MIPRFQQVDHAVQAKNSVFRSAPLHWHTHYEIELTVTGSVRHIVNGQVYMTSPGFVSIMTPCDFHQYVDSGCESRIKKLFFEENSLSPELLQLMLTMQVSRCILLNPQDFADVTDLHLRAFHREDHAGGGRRGGASQCKLPEPSVQPVAGNDVLAVCEMQADQLCVGAAADDGCRHR
ncbi:MAG: AraC family ligand binding domain-containing protein [Clostridia bacterium]|nr:AraC family ligand binding domain-containing protein [Clostridia bacterium]